MDITIKEKTYTIKYSLRSMLIFEQIKKTPFKLETLLDQFLLLYCMILANNKDVELTFDELLEELDNEPSLIEKFKRVMEEYAKSQSIFRDEEIENDGKKNS